MSRLSPISPTDFRHKARIVPRSVLAAAMLLAAPLPMADATKRETIMGSLGAASTPSFYARVLNDVFSTRLKLVTGYAGQTETFLAMERGELEGYPSTFWSSLKTTRPDWIKENKVRLLVQYGQKPHPELPDMPVARDLAKSADDKALLDIAMASLMLGRPYLAPPEVPTNRVAALRAAMKASFADAAFRAEAKSCASRSICRRVKK